MYQSLSAERFGAHLGLPEGHAVQGFLGCGTWDLNAEPHLAHLRRALASLGIETELRRLEHSGVGHGHEFAVEGRNYWFAPVMGTAVMSVYAHVACLLGSRKNLLVGVVGGLREGVAMADFVVPTEARGNENALMYQRDATGMVFRPDVALRASLLRRLPPDVRVFEGPTLTCEAMLAETLEDVRAWSAAGYLGVEMEAALMFALSRRFGVPCAALLFVADNLVEETTVFDERYKTSKAARDRAREVQYRVAMEELLAP